MSGARPVRGTPAPWLEALDDVVRGAGLPLSQILASDAALDFVLDPPGSPRLVLQCRPAKEGVRAFKRTARFCMSYTGVRDPDPAQGKVLQTLAAGLASLEKKLPEFRGVAWIGDLDEPDPVAAFARRFPFAQLDRGTGPAGEVRTEVLARLTTTCNQNCPFCSAPLLDDNPSSEALQECFRWVSERFPGARLTLTGGEPSLRPDFAAELRAALSLPGVGDVLVQTNAVRFAKAERVAALPGDARLRFFVSLHAVDDAIYDRCTASRGQLPLALEGLKRLLGSGRPVTVNLVASGANVAHLPAYLDALPRLLEGLPKPVLHFSIVMCPPHRPGAEDFLVRYSELAPALEAAAAQAEALGFDHDPLVGSTHASMPTCLLGPAHRAAADHRPVIQPGETGYEDYSRGWVKAKRCLECAVAESCLGVPVPYAKRFGLDELRPLPRDRA